jgi:hypothetical protein
VIVVLREGEVVSENDHVLLEDRLSVNVSLRVCVAVGVGGGVIEAVSVCDAVSVAVSSAVVDDEGVTSEPDDVKDTVAASVEVSEGVSLEESE